MSAERGLAGAAAGCWEGPEAEAWAGKVADVAWLFGGGLGCEGGICEAGAAG